jgi:hypothetical protein
LDEHVRAVSGGAPENLGEVRDRGSVRATRWRHVDDVAFDQLDTRLVVEDADLRHAVVVGDADTVTTRQICFCVHGFTIGSRRVRVNGDSP